MPQPGDPCPGFIAQPGECWQMVYSPQSPGHPLSEDAFLGGAMVLAQRRPLVASMGLSGPP